jgi:starch phosphorylase
MTTRRPALSPHAEHLRDRVAHSIRYILGTSLEECSSTDLFRTFAWALRERLVDGMHESEARYRKAGAKRLYYLSAEFLVGQSLHNNLVNLGLLEDARQAAEALHVDLESLLAAEPDAALGNGGLGRLAACFLESLASLDYPGFGYGINYQFGLFRQVIEGGAQREHPDEWMAEGSPWQIARHDQACFVPVYGQIQNLELVPGHITPTWMDWKVIVGVPIDMPVVGYGGKTINYLRLYSARSSNEFDMAIFNAGDYIRAVQQKIATETVSKVLYPSDAVAHGQELRLAQEYFMVACAVRDIIRRDKEAYTTIDGLADRISIQMNDTHPALVVAELMRLFVDEESIPWDARGRWRRRSAATRTTRCCPRRSRNGPWRCSSACCRGTCR